MARQWWDHVTPTIEELKAERERTGTEHLANAIPGTLSEAIVAALPGVRLTAGGIEYGTHDIRTVLKSLRADNWVHVHGDPSSAFGREAKALVREMFYPSVFEWKIMVASRSNDVIRQALTGLAAA